MSRDKQIEEMAKAICSEYDCVIPCQSCAYYAYANCRDVKSAEKLYNAGYRKSTDVAEEIFAEISKASADWGCYCISAFKWGYVTSDVNRTLAELKKKYIGEDRDKLAEFGKYSPLSWKYTEGGE